VTSSAAEVSRECNNFLILVMTYNNQGDQVSGLSHSSSAGLCVQDYMSLIDSSTFCNRTSLLGRQIQRL